MADPLVRMGWASRLGFAASNPASPPADPTEELAFLDDSVTDTQTREDTSGTTGNRSVPADRMLEMARGVAGPLTFEPTPNVLLAWLPRIFGAAGSGSGTVAFGLGDVLPAFDQFSVRGDGLHVFRENVAASATFEAQQGGRFRCTVNVLGKDRDAAIQTGYTWPSGLAYERAVPWRLADATLTVGGVEFKFYRFALTVDNGVQPRFMSGSLAPTELPVGVRRVMLGLSTPWGNGLPKHQTLRTSPLNTCVLKLQRGTGSTARSVQFNLPVLIPPENRSPVVPGKEEVRYDVELQACATTTAGAMDANSEVTATVKAGDG